MAFPLPDKPSIAVLPFVNMSEDPKQEFFCDGLTDTVITRLSQIPHLFVIASNSSFAYKGKPVKVQQVAEDLGVQYVLEGSMQKSEERIRLSVQLIDALSGRHLWAESYDRDLEDIFALQDEIASKVITSLQVKLTSGEYARAAGKATRNLQALQLFWQAQRHLIRFTKEDNALAKQYAQKAIEIDPEFSTGWAELGFTHLYDSTRGWSSSRKQSMKLAEECAQKALSLNPLESKALFLLTWISLFKREYDKAIEYAERAVEVSPNNPYAFSILGMTMGLAGRSEEGVANVRKAMRLTPHYPPIFLMNLAYNLFFLRRYDDALSAGEKLLERCRKGQLAGWIGNLLMVAIYSELGQDVKARKYAADILNANPNWNLKVIEGLWPYKEQPLNRLLNAGRKAGLPEKPPLPLPDKPSIAVLPFVNMSGDPEQEYFSDGITEDIITNLSKVSGLFVISRNSSFLYKAKQVKLQDVARDLGVRYVLEGSVRRVGNRVRITAQLIDGKTEHHVWADNYDRELRDIFSVQDEVTQRVVTELAVALTASESERLARKHTESFEAYDLYLRGRRAMAKLKKENHLKTLKLFERSIEIDPNFAGGYAGMSYALSRSVRFGYSTSPSEDVDKALELAKKGVSVDDTFYFSYHAMASAYLMKRRHDEALAAITAGVRIQPGASETYLWLGFYLHWMGRGEEALQALKKAKKLNPKYLSSWHPGYMDFVGYAAFTAGRYEESIAAWKQAIDHFGPLVVRQAFLAASYSELDREEEARAMAQQLLEANPKFSLSSWELARTYKNPKDTEKLLTALSNAGLQ
jgi:TolB-like protein/Flp pilus assembly protein TadD